MMTAKPILFSELDFKRLNFPIVGKDIRIKGKTSNDGTVAGAGNGMTVFNITYGPEKAPVHIRFPICISTIGLRRNTLGEKYTVPITFTNVDPMTEKLYGTEPSETPTADPFYSQGQLYNFFKELEQCLHAAVQKHSDAWLGAKENLSDKRVKELFHPVVKPHLDRVLGTPTGKYAPTVTLEVGTIGVSQLDLSIRDMRPSSPMGRELLDNRVDNLLLAMKGGVHFRGVFSFNGLFYVNNKFSATFTLLYAEVMPPFVLSTRTTASSMVWDCLEDTEDEKAALEITKKARVDASDGQTFAATSFLADRPGTVERSWTGAGVVGAGAGSRRL
jgi:hypothetical protein